MPSASHTHILVPIDAIHHIDQNGYLHATYQANKCHKVDLSEDTIKYKSEWIKISAYNTGMEIGYSSGYQQAIKDLLQSK